MRRLLEFFIKNKIGLAIVIVILISLGSLSIFKMPVDLFPPMNIPVVSVISHYPGASPKDMETSVTKPIEEKMLGIPNVKRVSSVSAEGSSVVTVEFNWGTPLLYARQTVQSKLSEVLPLLPKSVMPRIDSIGTRLQNIYGFILYGDNPSKLYDIARYKIAPILMNVNGISSADVIGGNRKAIIIKIPIGKLLRSHVSLEDILKALKRSNLIEIAGFNSGSGKEYIVKGDARIRKIKDIARLPIKNHILLGSIANISFGVAPKHYVVYGNGQKAVAVMVKKEVGANTISVVKTMKQKLKDIKQTLPRNIRVKTFYNQAEIISESQREIVNDLLIGSILVFLILYLFLGSAKPTLIVVLTIPITFLTTILVMHMLNLTFNTITMSALALSIGMVVDDAIVVSENIYRLSGLLKDPLKASIEGTLEIAPADASGTFTTVAAFLPLLLLGGIASVFLKPFGITLSIALLVSLLLSLSIVPALFSMGNHKDIQKSYPISKIIGKLKTSLSYILRFSFKHRALTVITSILLLATIPIGLIVSKISLLPPIDEGAILLEYVMPPGTSLNEGNRTGRIIDETALKNPNVSTVYRRTGSPSNSYMLEGPNRGEIFIKLKPKSRRTEDVSSVIDELKKDLSNLKGTIFLFHQPTQENIDESFSGLPAFFGATIYGNNYQKLIDISRKVKSIMEKTPGITGVINNAEFRVPERVIKVRYPQLALYNLTAREVLDNLRAAKLGIEATNTIRNNMEIPIIVKLKGTEDLMNLPIVSESGSVVPLYRLVKAKNNYISPSITHLNGQREITITSDIDGNPFHIVKELKERIKLPKGYMLEFNGQYRVMVKTIIQFGVIALLAVILIYLIMANQFRSFIQPLVVLFVIPLSMVGAIVLLFLTHQGLNVSSAMGMITLIGISVNNAIVLVDYSNKLRSEGKTLEDSLIEAVSVRIRPILLTSSTTILGLLPAAIGTTIGSHIFQSFSITVIGGLITGNMATLMILPSVLTLVDNKHT